MLTIVVAMDRNRLIGRDNELPWRLPADLKYFKKVTTGSPIIMGRKTFESIGKPLPNRHNIVVTRNPDFRAEGCEIVHQLEELAPRVHSENESFLIGGAELFNRLIGQCGRMHITRIEHEFEGDTFFPAWDEKEWRLVSETPGVRDDHNPYVFTFCVYERTSS